jgi:hypothetical protein
MTRQGKGKLHEGPAPCMHAQVWRTAARWGAAGAPGQWGWHPLLRGTAGPANAGSGPAPHLDVWGFAGWARRRRVGRGAGMGRGEAV